MITLLYQSAWPLGGGTSYTAHLARVLAPSVRVVRIGGRTEAKKREHPCGFSYRRLALEDVLRISDGPILHTIGDPALPEDTARALAAKDNFWSTCFDSNELKLFPHWRHFRRDRVILIGESSLGYMPNGHVIPMPYVRRFTSETVMQPCTDQPRRFGCSVARICSTKNSEWLMEANRSLRQFDREIALLGQWDRMWHWSRISKRYPEYPYPAATGKGYPRRWGAAAEICARYSLMFDMSIFAADGGRPQYSLLEALDGGAVPVITAQWASYSGPAKRWSFVVRHVQDILYDFARIGNVERYEKLQKLRHDGQMYLEREHDPASIAGQYRDVLKEG
jgi:hypothetical protein